MRAFNLLPCLLVALTLCGACYDSPDLYTCSDSQNCPPDFPRCSGGLCFRKEPAWIRPYCELNPKGIKPCCRPLADDGSCLVTVFAAGGRLSGPARAGDGDVLLTQDLEGQRYIIRLTADGHERSRTKCGAADGAAPTAPLADSNGWTWTLLGKGLCRAGAAETHGTLIGLPEAPFAAPVEAWDGMLLVPHAGGLSLVDWQGHIQWTEQTLFDVADSSPRAVGFGLLSRLALAVAGPQIAAVDAQGKIVWSYVVPGAVGVSGAPSFDGTRAALSFADRVLVMELADGPFGADFYQATIPAGQNVFSLSSPVFLEQGRLAVLDSLGRLWSFGPENRDTPLALAQTGAGEAPVLFPLELDAWLAVATGTFPDGQGLSVTLVPPEDPAFDKVFDAATEPVQFRLEHLPGAVAAPREDGLLYLTGHGQLLGLAVNLAAR